MSLNKTEFANYIKNFNFRELFVDMGWNNDKSIQSVVVDNIAFSLESVAVKSGFKILVCSTSADGNIPDYSTRKKIETKVTKLFQEHLIIYCDQKKSEQIWQLVVRQAGKPSKITETRYNTTQTPELLFQRAAGIFFELDEEDQITIVDVTKRVAENFHQNNEKVTKKFYDRFKKEHTSFLKFITGISEKANQEWYASLMLNRLMFCYFIQKKGFLDKNKNYLREKLKQCQELQGKGTFYSFYRSFLLTLFHQGLGSPENDKHKDLIGNIPYLNGGLFDEHELEKTHANIDIEDTAFEKLFTFFDEYEWHLDTSVTATGKDINPDVIGYIFEKYINERAAMGAYYTKEDITDYISKNCIIPYLFDETKRHYPKVFDKDAEIWQNVKQSGDTYIYDAVKYGIKYEPQKKQKLLNIFEQEDHNQHQLLTDNLVRQLPEIIEQGINDVSKRTEWNKPAPSEYALPTEIWREVVDRRNRYYDVKNKIDTGEIQGINDFITHNLNIRQFAQDVIEDTNDPEFLKGFYKALSNVTIIDPTCGSGAFLFAAMNILEPMYEACLMRMRGFVEDEDRKNREEKKNFSHKYKYFRDILQTIQNEHHPNQQYFIYKNIILRNLYGVDIMKEAVEIAKLRLFLKLVATVEADYRKPNLGLEPLPDIDFNIRAGNTLVGFATEDELEKALIENMDGALVKSKIEEQCDIVSRAFARYKEIQLGSGDDFREFKVAKDELLKRLKVLNSELSHLLYPRSKELPYDTWLNSHQPFHWFAEYFEIVHNGGFDIIIGNPPYVEYAKSKKNYILTNYVVQDCGNLFGFVCERAKKIISVNGYLSLIVPISVICTQRMEIIQKLLFSSNKVWLSNYGERPSKLFSGAEVLLTIFIVSPEIESPTLYSSTFIKWRSEERPFLFDKLFYNNVSIKPKEYSIPKIGFQVENQILERIVTSKKSLGYDLIKTGKYRIFYRIGGGRYWKIFTDFSPKFISNGVNSTSSRENYIFANSENEKKAIISLLSSSLFYWYFVLTTNCRDLNPSDLTGFPILITNFRQDELYTMANMCDELMSDYNLNCKLKDKTSEKTGGITYQEFYPRLSKHIIDKIDTVIAEHFGFTDEELDFIINYDIKYRMGKELDSDEE